MHLIHVCYAKKKNKQKNKKKTTVILSRHLPKIFCLTLNNSIDGAV